MYAYVRDSRSRNSQTRIRSRDDTAESRRFRLETSPSLKIMTRRLYDLHQKRLKQMMIRRRRCRLRLASTRRRRRQRRGFVGGIRKTTVEAAAERAGMGGGSTEAEAGRGSGFVRHWKWEVITLICMWKNWVISLFGVSIYPNILRPSKSSYQG